VYSWHWGYNCTLTLSPAGFWGLAPATELRFTLNPVELHPDKLNSIRFLLNSLLYLTYTPAGIWCQRLDKSLFWFTSMQYSIHQYTAMYHGSTNLHLFSKLLWSDLAHYPHSSRVQRYNLWNPSKMPSRLVNSIGCSHCYWHKPSVNENHPKNGNHHSHLFHVLSQLVNQPYPSKTAL